MHKSWLKKVGFLIAFLHLCFAGYDEIIVFLNETDSY